MDDRSAAAGAPTAAEEAPVLAGPLAADLRRVAILGVAYALAALVFWFDSTVDSQLASGVLYVPLVLTAAQSRRPGAVWLLAAVATALTIIGGLVPVLDRGLIALVNRSLSIGAILLTASLVAEQQKANTRLAATISRAEDAEAAKTRLLGNASHDFRNSLNAVLGFTELLKYDCLPAQKDALSAIEQGGRRLLDSVENLIDLTALDEQGPSMAAIDLDALLEETVTYARVAAQGRSVMIVRDPPFDGIPLAYGDQWAVRRILNNLFQNAVKFSPIGGRVRTRLQIGHASVAVEIEDEGCGIRQDVVPQLGQTVLSASDHPRSDTDGLGIGLALATKLAALIDARLDFSSQPGAGTTATLTLPLAASRTAALQSDGNRR
ncbi:MAG TPA: HAMP domain-containing sensor histidine kinase [Alphaproteobacteria bacterium]|nr:HAMP domain-containing sensor histidine kinase [Alphaproteobacteria bacterium]